MGMGFEMIRCTRAGPFFLESNSKPFFYLWWLFSDFLSSIWLTVPYAHCSHCRKHCCGSESGSVGSVCFGPPGSGSINQRHGSGFGSFYHQTKIVRKSLIPTVLLLLFYFLSLKNDLYVPSKSNKQENLIKKFFVGLLKVNDENWRVRIRIQIHYSDAWISGSEFGSTPKCHGSATYWS